MSERIAAVIDEMGDPQLTAMFRLLRPLKTKAQVFRGNPGALEKAVVLEPEPAFFLDSGAAFQLCIIRIIYIMLNKG
ncbi:hypothetical protein PO883_18410 [Massilia sp. DJPM01]|uniref:hypothetical protein n=1 Tax=Massilia sp. DJPM01 TaxID=3024404 RepID=UPI00259FD83A|nr:hypothetical protein [Massilia sp. DJPM01]MDM5179172.1 hypothetical protein [Massilia sp. DJPM01]